MWKEYIESKLKIKINMRTILLVLLFLSCRYSGYIERYIEEHNQKLKVEFRKNIPAVAIMDNNPRSVKLDKALVIFKNLNTGDEYGILDDLCFKGCEKEIVGHYKKELDRIGKWQYKGGYIVPNGKKPEIKKRNYYWEEGPYMFIISFNFNQSEQYDQTRKPKESNGLEYKIYVKKGLLFREIHECQRID